MNGVQSTKACGSFKNRHIKNRNNLIAGKNFSSKNVFISWKQNKKKTVPSCVMSSYEVSVASFPYLILVFTEQWQRKPERKIVLLKTLIDLPSNRRPPYLRSDTQFQWNTHWRETLGHSHTHTPTQGSSITRRPSLLRCDWLSGWPSVATC